MFTGSKASTSQAMNTLSTSVTEDEEGESTLELGSPIEPRTSQIPIESSSVVNNVRNRLSNSSSSSSQQEDESIKSSTPMRIHRNLLSGQGSHPLFTVEQLGADRRLLINRKRQLKMYRIWMQGKFQKNGP